MKRYVLNVGAGIFLAGALTAAAEQAPGPAELMKLIEKQNQMIEELSTRIRQLESRGSSAETKEIKKVLLETNEALAETNKKVDKVDGKLGLGKGIAGLKVSGDMRVRYEQRDKSIDSRSDGNDGDRSRMRGRLRLGGVWTNKDEKWEVGVGLASGSGASGRSTNQDWASGGVFDSTDVWLDYYYAKHKMLVNEAPVSLTLGQQKNPLICTMLNWDSDLRPIGFTAQYGDPMGKEYSGPFATAGLYMVKYLSDGRVVFNNAGGREYIDGIDDNVWLSAFQAGYTQKGDDLSWLVAGGFSWLNDAYRNAAAIYANSAVPNNVVGLADTQYNYQIVDLYGEMKTNVAGMELKPFAHAAMNLGANGQMTQAITQANLNRKQDPHEENLAWMVGVDAKRGKWTLGYGYAYIGADAVFGPMRDSDFGETAGLEDTDVQGHVIRVGYNLSKNVNLGATLLLCERINGGDANANDNKADSANLLQIDAVYKF